MTSPQPRLTPLPLLQHSLTRLSPSTESVKLIICNLRMLDMMVFLL